MAEVPTLTEETKAPTGADNLAGFNLVDIAGSHTTEKQIKPLLPAESVANPVMPPLVSPPINLHPSNKDTISLPRNYVLDPTAWNQHPLSNIYENGVVKLFSNEDGRQQFGVKLFKDHKDRTPVVPIHKGNIDDKAVQLQFRLRF